VKSSEVETQVVDYWSALGKQEAGNCGGIAKKLKPSPEEENLRLH